MLGTWVNVAAVLVGGSIGLLIKKGLSQRLGDTLMKGIGMCLIYIGISGALSGQDTLKLILSVVFGAFIGEGLDLDGKVRALGSWVAGLFQKKEGRGGDSIAEGFITASLGFCVGAMTVVGSLQSGLTGNHEMLLQNPCWILSARLFTRPLWGCGFFFPPPLYWCFRVGSPCWPVLYPPFWEMW